MNVSGSLEQSAPSRLPGQSPDFTPASSRSSRTIQQASRDCSTVRPSGRATAGSSSRDLAGPPSTRARPSSETTNREGRNLSPRRSGASRTISPEEEWTLEALVSEMEDRHKGKGRSTAEDKKWRSELPSVIERALVRTRDPDSKNVLLQKIWRLRSIYGGNWDFEINCVTAANPRIVIASRSSRGELNQPSWWSKSRSSRLVVLRWYLNRAWRVASNVFIFRPYKDE